MQLVDKVLHENTAHVGPVGKGKRAIDICKNNKGSGKMAILGGLIIFSKTSGASSQADEFQQSIVNYMSRPNLETELELTTIINDLYGPLVATRVWAEITP